MRKLHPVGLHETPLDSLSVRRADGRIETATVHQMPGDRLIVRVEMMPIAASSVRHAPGDAGAAKGGDDGRSSLWHLMLDADGRPERLEARLEGEGGVVDVTVTFFEDEVLVWRRGAAPSTESVAVPPGYRLWWPPLAGRDHCLAGIPSASGRDAVMTCLVRLVSPERGHVGVRPVKFTVNRSAGALTLATPGLPADTVELDAAGRARRWLTDDAELGVRVGP